MKELRGFAADGKLSNRLNMALRKQKKAVAVKRADLFWLRDRAFAITIRHCSAVVRDDARELFF